MEWAAYLRICVSITDMLYTYKSILLLVDLGQIFGGGSVWEEGKVIRETI